MCSCGLVVRIVSFRRIGGLRRRKQRKRRPVVPPPVDESIDLTASEAYANCFIVTEADEYRFATRKVDGSDVEGIVSVDWLWSTKNAAGNPLVSEVSYKDGIVHFTSDGTEGNTVLAAFDAKGEVIWSWHLWMTDQPELFAYDEGGELMDRNLGATSALEADGAASFGLLYQWGRKDPFYGGEKNEDSGDGVFLRARESTIVNPAHASLAWIAVQCDEQVGTVAYATAHPTTFLFNSPNGNKDWLFTGEEPCGTMQGRRRITIHVPPVTGCRIRPHGAISPRPTWTTGRTATASTIRRTPVRRLGSRFAAIAGETRTPVNWAM